MQLSRIRKWSVMLLVICSIVGLLAACGKKDAKSAADSAKKSSESTPPEEETEDLTKLSEIDTDFGTLYIPQKYEQLLKTDIDSDTVKFSTEQEGKTYTLFDLSIDEEVGQLVGTLTDEQGNSHDVYVTVYDLGDISEMAQDKQDQLYAMQEAVNVIVENLK